jgi:hypothetical protein
VDWQKDFFIWVDVRFCWGICKKCAFQRGFDGEFVVICWWNVVF